MIQKRSIHTLSILFTALALQGTAWAASKPTAAKAAAKPASAAASSPVAPAAAASSANAGNTGSITTASGIVYEVLRAGTGAHPTAADKVKVHYVGRFLDGREFDSSIKRGVPAEFPLGRVIKCWTEGVQLMQVGGKARLHCPSALAYGERGAGGGEIPPNTALVFEVELLGISTP
ncbi:peptidylprolyl isomerase [Paucibacter sp. KBW04]|uniref:FKBP-type peptidyl-prolyl cis-trans isomerase n=1 Tax=Paucibacter sp. KBW04 TaxID=2153361 RepID=UPI000F57E43A|nr:FKBP-type peptidyl-prolyl cis-trans isomerase [Paucibacter sp. KBW04]RQO61115.1 peptidylprolyl isomerase [Paucibacter sp. KBW04]